MIRSSLLALVVSGFCFGGVASAQVLSVTEAEGRITEACKAEPGADPEACECYIVELKKALPKDSYEIMTVLAAIAVSGDDEGMKAFAEEEDLAYDEVNELLVETRLTLNKVEEICGY
ncbi:hypothetical protein GCM10007972_09930 [Iodidimonas muriae]|uniref:Uncharacterized protein n=1 Tax=Iodidimonas muriae TaxID=261467 RepID=A0ABQ2LC58_9PROT|nr:hypothetical protein [Iodidimonas muriae]GER08069.1 hypothetical protein JCM17843_23790 [Kordiimonadales bacterium JCM 17843]GGO08957.1 hypothetical protein GCM10007972_09930 [Iodidimonas muriae]